MRGETRASLPLELAATGFVLFHPWRKDKGAPRLGPPAFLWGRKKDLRFEAAGPFLLVRQTG